jgi:EAL domain-containing protein (putative c-di-GMP-specific phosphodiesterase class I)
MRAAGLATGPFVELKLDRSFVKDSGSDPRRRLGGDIGNGYFLPRPMPKARFIAVLE